MSLNQSSIKDGAEDIFYATSIEEALGKRLNERLCYIERSLRAEIEEVRNPRKCDISCKELVETCKFLEMEGLGAAVKVILNQHPLLSEFY
jgi:hypothetical protein